MVNKAKILIVEDELITARDIESCLKEFGYLVTGIVTSGEDAVKKTERSNPDLVLMDIRLKGKMDGIEAAQIIRDKFNIPVIYLTAHSDKETLKRAKITKPFGYVLKPFQENELHTQIEMALECHSVELKLRESEERYKNIMQQSLEAIYILDPLTKNVLEANKAFYELLGYDKKNVKGLKVYDFVNHTKKSIDNNIEKIIESGTIKISEREWKKKDGTLITVEVNVSKFRLNDKDIICIIARDITESKQREKIKVQELRQRIAAVMDAQENERHRIAIDLHDGLGQLLTVISYKVDNILSEHSALNRENKLQRELLEVQRSIDEALDETKNIAHDLMPVILKDFGIIPALRQLCKQVKQQSGTNITFRAQNINGRIESDLERTLYRVTQEALANMLKHSKAEKASVHLSINNDNITLRIRDKGKGFDSLTDILHNNKKKQLGLISMQERILAFNGTLNINSSKGFGTEIIAKIPFSLRND
ncbi:MAG: response regulator [Bacteroidetes bacterium]|nr:response regulator [Bacteroidota bacterium]